ncbi:hypothetical protein, partial [Escherichia coli]|uniref:hypothetical protein n=1 Tax=Escherichia coli TaxID=562 RepID=UPI001BC89F5E
LPSETMIWQPEFTDKTLSRKPGAVQSVTVTDNLHTSLHFPSFLCVFSLAKSRRADHNQDPRGIDW